MPTLIHADAQARGMHLSLRKPDARLALGATLAAAWAIYTLHVGVGFGGGLLDAVDTPIYDGLLLAAAAVCLIRVRVMSEDRAAWLLIGAGLTVWAAADVYFNAAFGDGSGAPFPSLADAGWLAFYPASYIALVLLLRSRVKRMRASLWLDGLLGSLSVAALGAALALEPIVAAGSGSTADIATNLAYPLGDLLLVAFVAAAVAFCGWRLNRMWAALGAGLVLSGVADSWYLLLLARGSYHSGGLLDALWPAATLLIALAAWLPDRRSVAKLDGWRVLAAPALAMATALGILVFDHFQRVTTVAIVLATAAILAGIVRMALTFSENLRALDDTREEAFTDALTGLGNRRRLLSDLEGVLNSRAGDDTHLLIIFDLNGFKSYNDSFGHPAGDQLLARLGRRLSQTVTAYGRAYRLGGDEFCVLARPGRLGPDAILEPAIKALSEQGEGFAVDSSYGSVLLPQERTEIPEVMRLADRRMYALKHQARPPAPQENQSALLSSLRVVGPELRVHLNDVSEFASEVGRELGMGSEELDELIRAAELHDVGKIAIPDAILNKPSPLDEEEWSFMRRHPIIGERILAAAPALRPVARLVRFSHEHWDGSGYPDGIAGDRIPMGARIVAVCDSYHAMITHRPYRAAVSEDHALTEVQRCAGRQYDPRVVEAFVTVLFRREPATPA
jgi:two-component system, cell cycle response regulator